MKRVVDSMTGIVHFAHPTSDGHSLCAEGRGMDDLFGGASLKVIDKATDAQVTCPKCAKIWMMAKYCVWNEVADGTFDHAMYDAVKNDGKKKGESDEKDENE